MAEVAHRAARQAPGSSSSSRSSRSRRRLRKRRCAEGGGGEGHRRDRSGSSAGDTPRLARWSCEARRGVGRVAELGGRIADVARGRAGAARAAGAGQASEAIATHEASWQNSTGSTTTTCDGVACGHGRSHWRLGRGRTRSRQTSGPGRRHCIGADDDEFLPFVQEWRGPQWEWQRGEMQELSAPIRDSALGPNELP